MIRKIKIYDVLDRRLGGGGANRSTRIGGAKHPCFRASPKDFGYRNAFGFRHHLRGADGTTAMRMENVPQIHGITPLSFQLDHAAVATLR